MRTGPNAEQIAIFKTILLFGKRERMNLHPLPLHPPNACSSPGCSKPKPGADQDVPHNDQEEPLPVVSQRWPQGSCTRTPAPSQADQGGVLAMRVGWVESVSQFPHLSVGDYNSTHPSPHCIVVRIE